MFWKGGRQERLLGSWSQLGTDRAFSDHILDLTRDIWPPDGCLSQSTAFGDAEVALVKSVQHLQAHVGWDDDAVIEEKHVVDNGEVALIRPILMKKRILGHECWPSPLTKVANFSSFRVRFLLGDYLLELA